MKRLILLGCVALVLSCNSNNKEAVQEDKIEVISNDELVVVEAEKPNKLLRKYNEVVQNYSKAVENEDWELEKKLHDSLSYYDRKIFVSDNIGKLNKKEYPIYMKQLNELGKQFDKYEEQAQEKKMNNKN